MSNEPALRVPPNSMEAEQAAIGAALIDPDAAELVSALPCEAWYREAHRTITDAMRELIATRQPVDLVTVHQRLAETGQLDDVGGLLYLSTLAENVPSASGADSYCKIVSNTYKLRALIKAAHNVTENAYCAGAADADTIVTYAEEQFLGVGRQTMPQHEVDIGRLAVAAYNDLKQVADRVRADDGLVVPWVGLARHVRRMRRGHFVVLAARPGVGKTAMGLNLAIAWAQQGIPGIIYSAEMTGRDMALRAILTQARPEVVRDDIDDPEILAKCADSLMPAMWQGVAALHNLPLLIDDRSSITPATVAAGIRRQQSRGQAVRFILVDYVQLLHSAERQRHMSRAEEVARIVNDLRGIAKEYGVTVVALTQVNRQTVEGQSAAGAGRIGLHNLAESDALGKEAHLVLALRWPAKEGSASQCLSQGYPDPEYWPGIVEVAIVKQREGVSGKKATLWYDGATCRYRDLRSAEHDALRNAQESARTRGGKEVGQ